MLASRLLWDKGVGEFVEAAEILRAEGREARFMLVGDADDANPASIDDGTLGTWKRSGTVELWGRREDMPDVLPQAHIVCLPSYREGLPKVLIEAASCGRPIVTTDAPGCREIVHHGENGLLVDLRSRMGQAGRELVKKEFTIDAVVKSTLGVYETLLQGGGR
jgi:glycosyltransferase involved in cell wall biosynthesis